MVFHPAKLFQIHDFKANSQSSKDLKISLTIRLKFFNTGLKQSGNLLVLITGFPANINSSACNGNNSRVMRSGERSWRH